MKGKIILIGFILIFLIGVVIFVVGSSANDKKNEEIINFTVELIKGNKSLEDIDSFSGVNRSVKEVWRDYYTNTFYDEGDKVLVYEGVELLDIAEDEAKKAVENSYVDGVFSMELYLNNIMPDDFILESTGDDFIIVDEHETFSNDLYEALCIYSPYNKDTNNYTVENNNLYVNPNELKYVDGCANVIYKGFKVLVAVDGLDKKLRSEMIKMDKYSSIEITDRFVEDNREFVNLTDNLKNRYSFSFDKKFGSITNMVIK